MVFRDILKEMVDQLDGALAASLMADDGIQVADYVDPDKDKLGIQNLAIEFAVILKEVGQFASGMMKGEIEEVMVSTREFTVFFFPVHENYFIALLMQRHGNLGKGRYIMRQYRPKIVEQL